MTRLKSMRLSDFTGVLEGGWQRPVVLGGDAIPTALRSIPEGLRYRFIASGELLAPVSYQSPRIGETQRVGGIYVFRLAPDDPVAFNRDDYAFILSSCEEDTLWIDGPYKHRTEHWTDEVPGHLQDIDVSQPSEPNRLQLAITGNEQGQTAKH